MVQTVSAFALPQAWNERHPDRELEPRKTFPSSLSNDLRTQMLEAVPSLRAFAISLTGSLDQADDLVQETLLKALSNLDKFDLNTNLQAWLFVILRNQSRTNYRKRKREVEDPNGLAAGALATLPDQLDQLDLKDVGAALLRLPIEQREALLLTAAEGLSYEETARICHTQIGTIKSRVNRARAKLAELLGHD